MHLLTLCGSARPDSSNRRLLDSLPKLAPHHQFSYFAIHQLTLFADLSEQVLADEARVPCLGGVARFKAAIRRADGIIISTPEYAHNLPAALKNALEWLVAGGEMAGKSVLPVVLTPHAPRGEKCMQSLCWTLAALDARIVAQLPLYRGDLTYAADGSLADCPGREMLENALMTLF